MNFTAVVQCLMVSNNWPLSCSKVIPLSFKEFVQQMRKPIRILAQDYRKNVCRLFLIVHRIICAAQTIKGTKTIVVHLLPPQVQHALLCILACYIFLVVLCPAGKAVYNDEVTNAPKQCVVTFINTCPFGFSCQTMVSNQFQGYCCSISCKKVHKLTWLVFINLYCYEAICPNNGEFVVDQSTGNPLVCFANGSVAICPANSICLYTPGATNGFCCKTTIPQSFPRPCPEILLFVYFYLFQVALVQQAWHRCWSWTQTYRDNAFLMQTAFCQVSNALFSQIKQRIEFAA